MARVAALAAAILLALPLGVGGCRGRRAARPAEIASLTYVITLGAGGAGGTATVAYRRDGHEYGGHLSGDMQRPWVHQDEGTVDTAVVAALWSAARALGDSVRTKREQPQADWNGYTLLQIGYTDSTVATLAWRPMAEHQDPRVRALVSVMLEHKIGGW
jgi:hypothetical protein